MSCSSNHTVTNDEVKKELCLAISAIMGYLSYNISRYSSWCASKDKPLGTITAGDRSVQVWSINHFKAHLENLEILLDHYSDGIEITQDEVDKYRKQVYAYGENELDFYTRKAIYTITMMLDRMDSLMCRLPILNITTFISCNPFREHVRMMWFILTYGADIIKRDF